jgi:signal transduction histidine kinase
MNFGSSIFSKLLFVILPLVCVPVSVVGYFSVTASADRVNRLVRQEQMLNLQATAKRIDDIFANCRMDLETISRLPVLEDYQLAKAFRLEAEAEFNHENIVRIFTDFLDRNSHYHRLTFFDKENQIVLSTGREGQSGHNDQDNRVSQEAAGDTTAEQGPVFSPVYFSPFSQGHLIQAVKTCRLGALESQGLVSITLDFEKIVDIVKAIQVGERGYAFLVDAGGRNIAHPFFDPYRINLLDYPETSVRELGQDMQKSGTGWKSYHFQGEDKVAAYAPIPIMNWSLAVTIPSVELTKEAQAIRNRVIQVVLITIVLALAGAGVLAYSFLRPVGRLVNATKRVARGDRVHEIPVQSNDELGQLTESFNHMVRNLSRVQNELIRSEKLISLGRLSSGVAHEIRNPLNAMKGAVVYIKRHRADDELVTEYGQVVLDEIDRLNRFVTEFLFFAKQSPPRLVPTDLNKLIVSTQTLFEEQARGSRIVLLNNLDPNMPLIQIDPHQMERVLVNILINAMEAISAGGNITFATLIRSTGSAEGAAQRVRITVHDNGAGIPDEHLPNIFDPFFTTKETGTGLGLPLSLGIVEYHGGTIGIDSKAGQGTTVTIELPYVSDATEKVEQF